MPRKWSGVDPFAGIRELLEGRARSGTVASSPCQSANSYNQAAAGLQSQMNQVNAQIYGVFQALTAATTTTAYITTHAAYQQLLTPITTYGAASLNTTWYGTQMDDRTWAIWITQVRGKNVRVPEILRAEQSDSTLWTAWVTTHEVHRAERRRRAVVQQEQEARERARQQEREERARQEQEAVLRARELLISLLDETQRRSFERDAAFHVRTDSGRRYELSTRHVYRMHESGQPDTSYCIHPPTGTSLPAHDRILALKLLLEADEAEFLRIANATPLAVARVSMRVA